VYAPDEPARRLRLDPTRVRRLAVLGGAVVAAALVCWATWGAAPAEASRSPVERIEPTTTREPAPATTHDSSAATTREPAPATTRDSATATTRDPAPATTHDSSAATTREPAPATTRAPAASDTPPETATTDAREAAGAPTTTPIADEKPMLPKPKQEFSIEKSQLPRSTARLARAVAAYRQGDHAEALALFEQLTDGPHAAAARFMVRLCRARLAHEGQ
jgi:hypothetical protein